MQYLQEGCPDRVTVETVAHTYGEMNLVANYRTYNEIADVLNSEHDYQYYWRQTRNQQQLAYRFNEYNPDDTQKVYPFLTNRTITAESNKCYAYHETGTDNKEPQTFTYSNGIVNGSITIPNEYLGREGTTYIYRAFHDPTHATAYGCGDRCIWMWAYKNPSGSPEPSAFYQCSVNISQVNNASQPEHFVPNDVAKIAAASIALQGRYSGPVGNVDKQDNTQYQFYASGLVIPSTFHPPTTSLIHRNGDTDSRCAFLNTQVCLGNPSQSRRRGRREFCQICTWLSRDHGQSEPPDSDSGPPAPRRTHAPGLRTVFCYYFCLYREFTSGHIYGVGALGKKNGE